MSNMANKLPTSPATPHGSSQLTGAIQASIYLVELSMARSRSGLLIRELAWLLIARPTRRCGVSNGYLRQEEAKHSPQPERIGASLSTEKRLEADRSYFACDESLEALQTSQGG